MPTAPYRPLDPDFLADPYEGYRFLRDHHPAYRHHAPDFVALSRFEDVWAAVRDHQTYSSASGLTYHPDEIGALGLPPTLVMLDPPRQVQLRKLISAAFTPRRVTNLEPAIRAFVTGRIDDLERHAGTDQADLHRHLSAPLPTYVLALLLDVPRADRARFGPWVSALTRLADHGFDPSALDAPTAVAEMFDYFSHAISARRESPGDDLISALVAAEVEGERLTDWDILGFLFVIVAGGNDTTANLISSAMALLSAAPDQRQVLLEAPDLLPGAVTEFLRLESPVQALARTTTRPVTLHGEEIAAGTKVLMLYGSANRDEREFGPDAHRLDVRRQIPRHLAFTSGVHFCIGSHLARLQARVALEELLRRHPWACVDTDAGERAVAPFTRGWVSLPLDLSRTR